MTSIGPETTLPSSETVVPENEPGKHHPYTATMTRLLDRLADWLLDVLGARMQLRAGVVLTFGTFPLYLWLPFSGEPPVVYVMSAAALTLTGVGIVVGAQVLERQE